MPKKELKVEGLAKAHPIVPIVLSKNNQETNSLLTEFLEHEINSDKDCIPASLAEFYGDYVEFCILKYLRYFRSQYGPRHYRWNIRDAINQLSKLAFNHFVRGIPLTDDYISQHMKNVLPLSRKEESDSEFRAFGLLEVDGERSKKPHYKFKQDIVLEYLVAYFHFQEVLRKISLKRKSVISSAMRDSIRRLPATGDIWRMVFGLLHTDEQTKLTQKELFEEVIEIAKTKDTLSPFDITNVCVEAIFESKNAGQLADLVDEFTMNQTVNYSNVVLPASRFQYAIQAVGYLCRASPVVYGVHLSNFNLTAERVQLLADPVNAISDNNIQVLNLSQNPIGSSGMRKLQRFIVKSSLLTHLDMSSCQLGDVGVALLSEFFLCVPLLYLKLSDNKIKDRGMKRMVANFKYLPTLEWLDLSDNELTDVSVKEFGEHLPCLKNLRSLDLRRNKIGDTGVEAISRKLANLRQVSHIMLGENQIGETGAADIADHAWKTKSLRYINLDMNKIPTTGVLGLRRAEESHGLLKIQISGQSAPAGLETSGLSDGDQSVTFTALDDTLGASYCTQEDNLSDLEKSMSVDLLHGRPDKNHVVMRKKGKGTLPRGMSDFRRSWHGASSSFRESVRSLRHSKGDSFKSSDGDRHSLQRSRTTIHQ